MILSKHVRFPVSVSGFQTDLCFLPRKILYFDAVMSIKLLLAVSSILKSVSRKEEKLLQVMLKRFFCCCVYGTGSLLSTSDVCFWVHEVLTFGRAVQI